MPSEDLGNILAKFTKRHGYVIVLGTLTVIFYIKSLSIGFISDDFAYIGRGLSATSFENVFQQGRFTPLFHLYFSVAANLFGLSPLLFHVSNLLFHTINGILVYHILRTCTERNDVSLIGAILFVGFYKSSSQIIWITNVHGLMVSSWYLAACLTFIIWIKTKNRRFYVFSLLTFTMALLTKEDGISLMPVLIAGWLIYRDRLEPLLGTLKAGILTFAPFAGILLSYLVIHTWTSVELGQSYTGFTVMMKKMDAIVPLIQRFKWFTSVLFFPELMYGTEEQSAWMKYALWFLKFIVLPVTLTLLWQKSSRGIRFFIAFTFLSMSPYILFTVAPRYVYLPSIGSSALFAYLIVKCGDWFAGKLHRYRLVTVIGITLIYLIVNGNETQKVIHRWQRAGNTAREIFLQLKDLEPGISPGSRLFFIGLTTFEDSDPYVYVIQNGLNEAVQLTYNDRSLQSFFADHEILNRHVPETDFVFEYRDGKLVRLTADAGTP